MTFDGSGAANVRSVNDGDKSTWPTIGCRIRRSDLFFVNRAIKEYRQKAGLAKKDYTRSHFLADAAVEKAMRVLGEEAEVIRASA